MVYHVYDMTNNSEQMAFVVLFLVLIRTRLFLRIMHTEYTEHFQNTSLFESETTH